MDVTGFVFFIGVDLHKCTVTLRAARADSESLGQLTGNTKCVERIGSLSRETDAERQSIASHETPHFLREFSIPRTCSETPTGTVSVVSL
jgi:hypothetical protein